ncbi:MAG: pseudouridine synthase [Dehalococcoidales bacterium]|nr:pseudouridine synthase [Dehalococcoidales bacterium]
MAQQPIIKLLTASGIGSRRKIAAVIKRGGVAINGKVAESFNEPVDSARDVITIDGKRASYKKEPDVYLMLNKPKGIVSSTSDDRGRKTVIDILPEKYRDIRIYPVGRLDKDSTGLVLLTNDGDLTFRLTHPRFEQEKEYLVQIDGELNLEEIAELAKGIYLDDGKTHPAKVKVSRYPPFSYSIAIHEGKKHQVRRMFAALGHDVLELKRIRLGSLRLNRLPDGEIRELSPAEVESLSKGAMRQKVR